MENEPKKISFGFNKLPKKSNMIVKQQPLEEKKVEIIEYLEEKAIKVIGEDDKPKGPLVIPMKHPNKKLINLVDIVKNDFQEPEPETNETKTENGSIVTNENQENLSLEEQAARELLNDTKNIKVKEEIKRVIDVSQNTDKITFEGEKESTIENYEEIPIDEFGKAMLRGMGWKDGHGIGKNEQLIKTSVPIQRPKGMGLGADKMTKQDKTEKPAVDRDGNALKCVKGAYVKVIAGYHKGNYGQIIGLDDESGRFIIKTALNSINISLNEFLVTPVTKDDYNKNSKVINNAKYEEYVKKKELEEKIKLEQEKIKKEKSSNSSDEEYTKRKDNRKDNEKKDKKIIKKERKSSESDREDRRSSRKETKKDKRSSDSEYEEKHSRKEKRTVKKERRSSESDHEEDRKLRRDKHEKSSKYDSDDYKREDSRDRRNRDKYKQSTSKHYSDSETEKRKSKKKSSKHDSDSEEYEQKKKHKKKKSKKHDSDEDSDDKHRRKSKKSDRKKYDDSDSEEDSRKSKKKDKKEKRDRSKHNKDRK